MPELPTYVLDRTFDAPRELVWKAWTDPALFTQWYGPRAKTIIHRQELVPGGLWLIEMQWNGRSKYERIQCLDVTPPERMVWLQATADAQWNIAASPMVPDWPRVLRTTVVLDERGGQTTMRLTWTPHEATTAEIACFSAAIGGLDKGWAAGMDLLTDLLARLQAAPR